MDKPEALDKAEIIVGENLKKLIIKHSVYTFNEFALALARFLIDEHRKINHLYAVHEVIL